MPATLASKTTTRAPDRRGPAVPPGEMLLEEFSSRDDPADPRGALRSPGEREENW